MAVALGVLTMTGCGSDTTASSSTPTGPSGIEITPPPDVSSVSLPDVANGGAEFPMRAQTGGLLLVFFGYTNCPDICPTTMSDTRTAVKKLGSLGGRIEVAMVTVDPARDSAEVLTKYVRSFHQNGHALRTDDDAVLRNAASTFSVQYEVATAADGSVEVGHSSMLFAVDDTGHVPMQWTFGTTAAQLATDLRGLLT